MDGLRLRTGRIGIHPDHGVDTVLPLDGGLRRALFQQQRRSDQGEGHRHGEDGGHGHQAVAPEVGGGLPRHVRGGERHQVRAAMLPGSSLDGSPGGA